MPRGGHNKIERDALLESVRVLFHELGETPRLADYRNRGEYSAKAIYNEFDSWNAALDELELDVHQRKNIDRVELACDGPGCEETVEKTPNQVDQSEFHYCSKACHYEHNTDRYAGDDNPASTLAEVACDACGETLLRPEWKRKVNKCHFCDKECEGEWRRENIFGDDHPQWAEYPTQECERCGKPFTVRPARADQQRYCSVDCKAAWQSDAFAAEGNPLWAGGKVQYMGANWPEQRQRAIIRDQARCQHSGCDMTEADHIEKEGRGLDVHHKTPRVEFTESGEFDWKAANNLENLVTLCGSHHKVWEHR
jgi:hypothetical protein